MLTHVQDLSEDSNNNTGRKKLGQGKKIEKSVFVIFYQGDQLASRVRKICEGCVPMG